MNASLIEKAYEQGGGVLRLTPTWVPRCFCIPGRRIKLHPDDYYCLGGARGGIDERWLASTTPADNGPLTEANEGLSEVIHEDGAHTGTFLLREAVEVLQGRLIGDGLWTEHGEWPMYSKFFDNLHALPHHIHQRDAHAALVDRKGKPEAYYFPPQLNNHGGRFPYTFFGFSPDNSKAQVRECLENFAKGDNRITALSRAHQLVPGTGWDVPAGVVHAPGSLCTYEPQKASDVFAMFQSVVDGMVLEEELLWRDSPPEKRETRDFDYLIELMDWEANVDPDFKANHYMEPLPVKPVEAMREDGYLENWICYRNEAYSAKELTVLPGRTATIRDNGAYGFIVLQGHGTLNGRALETPALIRYGERTFDEYFVSAPAAASGVTIANASSCDPLVMLKHFGPGNTDLPSLGTS